MAENSEPSNLLPSYEKAVIDLRKFTEYSMNPLNPQNQGKANAFKALGYDVDTLEGIRTGARDVESQLRVKLKESSASAGKKTPYGQRYQVRTEIIGPSGRTGILVTVWQYDVGSDAPRMVTNWLEVHK